MLKSQNQLMVIPKRSVGDFKLQPGAKRIGMFELAPRPGAGLEIYSILDDRSVVFDGEMARETMAVLRKVIRQAFVIDTDLRFMLPPVLEQFFRQ